MEILKTAIEAALDAGAAILEIYAQDFEVEFKADESPLTSADKAAHRIIVDKLEETAYPVLSEESAVVGYDERKIWDTYWLVDPIDGTKEFIKKNGEFTVNIALINKGVPVVGVVYVPVEDTLYIGVLSDEWGFKPGAWKALDCAGKKLGSLLESCAPISVSGTLKGSLRVVASKSHCNDETREFIKALELKYGQASLVSRGSSLKLCMIAEGSADIYPRIAPTMEWDTGAADAVVRAAGGRVYQFDSNFEASSYTVSNENLLEMPYNKEDLLNPYFVVSGLGK